MPRSSEQKNSTRKSREKWGGKSICPEIWNEWGSTDAKRSDEPRETFHAPTSKAHDVRDPREGLPKTAAPFGFLSGFSFSSGPLGRQGRPTRSQLPGDGRVGASHPFRVSSRKARASHHVPKQRPGPARRPRPVPRRRRAGPPRRQTRLQLESRARRPSFCTPPQLAAARRKMHQENAPGAGIWVVLGLSRSRCEARGRFTQYKLPFPATISLHPPPLFPLSRLQSCSEVLLHLGQTSQKQDTRAGSDRSKGPFGSSRKGTPFYLKNWAKKKATYGLAKVDKGDAKQQQEQQGLRGSG